MLKQSNRIEDNEKCKNRYQIRSETSDVIYIIGQEKTTGEWVCTCKQFSMYNRDRKSGYRPCKHLQIMQALLPELERKGNMKVKYFNCFPEETKIFSFLNLKSYGTEAEAIEAGKSRDINLELQSLDWIVVEQEGDWDNNSVTFSVVYRNKAA
jgi:hypothetical protein